MIGNIVKKNRIKKGLSESELARRSQTAVSNIHNIESGASKNPGWYTVLKIAAALEVDISDFIE
ncbi:MAG: helix-turn-helix transcriptional regulator [Eubacterium sp.]|nr:helix-turn-helix transcriptional regulator [Eubacterium sp.]